MSSLFHAIDIYCERTSAELMSEPLNAITNLAFFLAAYGLFKQLPSLPQRRGMVGALIILIALIGIGSSAFHLFANRFTMLMDVIPIALFLLGFIVAFCRIVMRASAPMCCGALASFMLLCWLTGFIPDAYRLNGSVHYLPALLFLLAMAVLAGRREYPSASRKLWQASGFLLVSMLMRSIDIALCDYLPIGTHFLWHILNGLVLYTVVSALIRVVKQQHPSTSIHL